MIRLHGCRPSRRLPRLLPHVMCYLLPFQANLTFALHHASFALVSSPSLYPKVPGHNDALSAVVEISQEPCCGCRGGLTCAEITGHGKHCGDSASHLPSPKTSPNMVITTVRYGSWYDTVRSVRNRSMT